MAKKRLPVKSLPFYGSKARFTNGDRVALPAFLGGICFEGIVTGKGRDEYGEYQEVRITSPEQRRGEVKKCRLMDLAWLVRIE